MPAPKKPVDRVQRRNKPKTPDKQVVNINTAKVPKPPVLPAALKDEWNTLWQSDLAAHWNQDSDLLAMRRLFGLYKRLAKYEQEGDRSAVTEGSTGQLTMHPLLKAADTLRPQILALEDRFGLTPMARLKLNISLGDSVISLDEMNKRLAADEDDDADDELDPRLTSIETTARTV